MLQRVERLQTTIFDRDVSYHLAHIFSSLTTVVVCFGAIYMKVPKSLVLSLYLLILSQDIRIRDRSRRTVRPQSVERASIVLGNPNNVPPESLITRIMLESLLSERVFYSALNFRKNREWRDILDAKFKAIKEDSWSENPESIITQILAEFLNFLYNNLETTTTSSDFIMCQDKLIQAMETFYSDYHPRDVPLLIHEIQTLINALKAAGKSFIFCTCPFPQKRDLNINLRECDFLHSSLDFHFLNTICRYIVLRTSLLYRCV
jgi:hypothetical protein